MDKTTKFSYGIGVQHIFMTVIFFTVIGLVLPMLMDDGEYLDAGVVLLVGLPGAIYLAVSFLRIGLSERAVYISNTDVVVPQANRYALPSLAKAYKNIRIPFKSIDYVSTSSSHNQDYLHIQFENQSTTVASAMFKSDAEYAQFKERLYSRLKFKQTV
jgi:hypothetical protein